jgi:hypothetical protein
MQQQQRCAGCGTSLLTRAACCSRPPASAQLFKANSSILNSLLTILNERTFDNGAARVHVPLLCLVGASNELPESDELDALFDRFLLRHAVSQARLAGRLRECTKLFAP